MFKLVNIVETIKGLSSTLGSIGGTLITLITLTGILFKPLRKKLLAWIRSASSADENSKMMCDLKATLDANNAEVMSTMQGIKEDVSEIKTMTDLNTEANKCMLSNRIIHTYEKYKNSDEIDLFERDSLIEHYRIYKGYDGNGMKEKVRSRYDEMMRKRVK